MSTTPIKDEISESNIVAPVAPAPVAPAPVAPAPVVEPAPETESINLAAIEQERRRKRHLGF